MHKYGFIECSPDFDVTEIDEVYDKSRLRLCIVNHIFFIHVIIYIIFSLSPDQLDIGNNPLCGRF